MEWKFAGVFFKGMKKTLVIGEGAHKWNPMSFCVRVFQGLGVTSLVCQRSEDNPGLKLYFHSFMRLNIF
jgi:hypothetical protein